MMREPGARSVSRIGGSSFLALGFGGSLRVRCPVARTSCGLRLQPDQGLSRGDRIPVLDQPLQDGGGEGRGDRVLAAPDLHMAQGRAGADVAAVSRLPVFGTGSEGTR